MPKESRLKPSQIAKSKQQDGELIPPPPDRPQQCHFWVARKRRYCSLPAKRTNKYCGEHLHLQQQEENSNSPTDKKRVPCPYDPSHTVYEKDLENHMKTRCNSRPRDPEAYYSLNINCTVPLSEEEIEFQKNIHSHKKLHSQPWIARVQLGQLPKAELDELIAKVTTAYDQENPQIEKTILTQEAVERRRSALKQTKHLDQQSSLLGHMEKANMLSDSSACFIEFGAGKGELSEYVKSAVQEKDGEATYVLVDRKTVRNKSDSVLLGLSKTKSTVQRVTIDIKDLELSKVQALTTEDGKRKKVVAFSKHLCGSATDITLKCIMNYVEEQTKAGNSNPIAGIIIALCCHQLCRYEMYPNTKFLEKHRLDSKNFARLCKMSSWAICGRRNAAGSTDSDDHAQSAVQEEEDKDETTNHYSGLNHKEREAIGYKCKRFLDIGRMRYLEEHNFKVDLVYYVDPATSLENCALIAVPK